LPIGPVWSRFSNDFTRRLGKARDVSNYVLRRASSLVVSARRARSHEVIE